MSDIRQAVLSDHIVTFGPEQHPVPNAVMEIHGCDEEQARAIAHAMYGPNWSALRSGTDRLTYMGKYNTITVLTVTVTGPDAL
jgi:hypothetical protein